MHHANSVIGRTMDLLRARQDRHGLDHHRRRREVNEDRRRNLTCPVFQLQ